MSPFMPPYQNANRENATASRTQIAMFLCPSDASDPVRRLARRQQLPGQHADLGVRPGRSEPLEQSRPGDTPHGIFYYLSKDQARSRSRMERATPRFSARRSAATASAIPMHTPTR